MKLFRSIIVCLVLLISLVNSHSIDQSSSSSSIKLTAVDLLNKLKSDECLRIREDRLNRKLPYYECNEEKSLLQIALNEIVRISNTSNLVEIDLLDLRLFNTWDVSIQLISVHRSDGHHSNDLKIENICLDNFWGSIYKDKIYSITDKCRLINIFDQEFTTDLFDGEINQSIQNENGVLFMMSIRYKVKNEQEFIEHDLYWEPRVKENSEIQKITSGIMLNDEVIDCVNQNYERVKNNLQQRVCNDKELLVPALKEAQRIAKLGKLDEPNYELFTKWNVKIDFSVYTGYNKTSKKWIGEFKCFDNFWNSNFRKYYHSLYDHCEMKNDQSLVYNEDYMLFRTGQAARNDETGDIYVVRVSRRNSTSTPTINEIRVSHSYDFFKFY